MTAMTQTLTQAAIRLNDYFLARLAEIGVRDAQAFERLLGLIETDVIPLLETSPDIGRLLSDDNDAPALLETLPRDELRVHELDDEYRLLYLYADSTVHLLSIRRLTTPSSSVRHSAQSDRSRD
jgi:hypothetical protein